MNNSNLQDVVECFNSLRAYDKYWLKMYLYAYMYYEEFNNLLIPSNYSIKSNNDTIRLGNWIRLQRASFYNKTLDLEKIKLLEQIGMVWELKKDIRWYKMFEYAKEYYIKNGNLLIPRDFTIMKDNITIKLGTWIGNQRANYKKGKLTQECIVKLESIGIVWELIIDRWDEMFEYAKDFYQKNGHLLIPYKYSFEKDNETINLGYWIFNQRNNYKKKTLSEDRINQLESIGMIWILKQSVETKEIELGQAWKKMYELVLKYYAEHNDIMIPLDYICIDDEKNEIKLGHWLNLQRKLKRLDQTCLNKMKIELLDNLGMYWDYIDNNNISKHQKQLIKKF